MLLILISQREEVGSISTGVFLFVFPRIQLFLKATQLFCGNGGYLQSSPISYGYCLIPGSAHCCPVLGTSGYGAPKGSADMRFAELRRYHP